MPPVRVCLMAPLQVEWNRAARTDKGVHAAAQVVSLKVVMPPGGEKELVERLSQLLPSDIACVDVIRTIASFNAKNQCGARQYEYLLPTFTLAPIQPSEHVLRYPAGSRAEATERLVAQIDCYTSGMAFDQAQVDERAGYRAASRSHGDHPPWLSSVFEGACSQPTHSQLASFGIRNAGDQYQLGVAADAAEQECRRGCASKALASRGPFRLSSEVHAELATTFAKYIGTKAFHNFTPRMTFGDASTSRYMSDARVSKPFVVGSGESALEYVKFTIVGQSFLYNQIRHMVGLAVDIARGAAPRHMFDMAFSAGVVRLPLAPAEGLFLSHCIFTQYDKRFATPPFRPLTFLSADAHKRLENFRDNVILRHIHETVVADKPFHKYLAELDSYSGNRYKVFIPVQLLQVLSKHPEYRNVTATATIGTKRTRATAASVAASESAAQPPDTKRARLETGDSHVRESTDPADEVVILDLRRITDLLFTSADPRFFSGLSISKVAKEKSDFKQNMRAELQADEDMYGKRSKGRGHFWQKKRGNK
jgi:tRNA pseudouridine38-40 synthase